MVRKRLLVGILSCTGIAALSTLIGIQYTVNSKSNRYQSYGSGPLSSSTTDLIQSYFSAAVNGSKLLYLASYSHTVPLTKALDISEANNKPIYEYLGKTGYILIDDQYGVPVFNDNGELSNVDQPIWSTNVASANFRVDLGSFVTGIAVGQFLNENMEYFAPNPNDKLTWATYGGAPYSSVTSFMGGLQRGVEWFNKNVVPKNDKFKTVEQVFIGHESEQNFSFTFDPSGGNNIIAKFLDMNVNVLIPIAGPQTSQAVRLIKQQNKKTVLIGVDSPLEEDDTVNLPLSLPAGTNVGNNKIIQFSSVKNLDVLTSKITQAINSPQTLRANANNFKWNDVGGFGYSSIGNFDNGGVGVSNIGRNFFVNAMQLYTSTTSPHNDIQEQYDWAIAQMSSLQDFKNLDLDENKSYIVGRHVYSYADIANNGYPMVPIAGTRQDIENWYDQFYSIRSSREKMARNKQVNLESLYAWIDARKATIDKRAEAMAEIPGTLTKSYWEKNHSLIKIIYQSPNNILFDHSFLESCYKGLRQYWETQGVYIPAPPSSSSGK